MSTARESAAPPLAYRDQSASRLVYHLYRGALDLTRLTVLASRDVGVAPGLEATLVVLGASHAVEVRWHGQRATELLACTPGPEGASLVDRIAMAPEVVRRYEVLPGLALELRLATIAGAGAAAGAVELARRSLEPEFARRGLAVRFPARPGGSQALTVVWADPDAPRIRSLHSYPHEDTIVVGETRFVL